MNTECHQLSHWLNSISKFACKAPHSPISLILFKKYRRQTNLLAKSRPLNLSMPLRAPVAPASPTLSLVFYHEAGL